MGDRRYARHAYADPDLQHATPYQLSALGAEHGGTWRARCGQTVQVTATDLLLDDQAIEKAQARFTTEPRRITCARCRHLLHLPPRRGGRKLSLYPSAVVEVAHVLGDAAIENGVKHALMRLPNGCIVQVWAPTSPPAPSPPELVQLATGDQGGER